MSYFINEIELAHLQCSYLYKNFSHAMIVFREMKRKDKFKNFSLNEFSNFYLRWNKDAEIEILFPDHSHLLIKLNERKCYVIHAQKALFKDFSIP